MKSTVSIFICLIALFGSSTSLKCYTCGWWSKNCGDPFLKDDYLLVECNTRAINDFNHELGNTLNTASNALQNFANQVGFNINHNNNYNLPTISEDSVGCTKVVLKHGEDIVRVARGCVYNKADLCKGMQRLDDELKTLKYCGSCDDDGCNGSRSLKSSAVAIILTAMATCMFYGLQH
ncbi:uncharacterized protein LOC114131347 [Aphis gossypii]|uniref:Protein sleepless n=1 Tax=Aphis gossypii TaxID=80765 RepID=A0A9P0NFE2_APHGO|nr:uncharacterized protein LOC114131347 [Aphis gossypii]CAH1724164.1 unnamed protein product [Aphis gossypii]